MQDYPVDNIQGFAGRHAICAILLAVVLAGFGTSVLCAQNASEGNSGQSADTSGSPFGQVFGDIWAVLPNGENLRGSNATVYVWQNDSTMTKLLNRACTASSTDSTAWIIARTELTDSTGMPMDANTQSDLRLLRALAEAPHATTSADANGHYSISGVPQGVFWLEAETIAPGGKIVQWWKVINLFRLPFRIRIAAPVRSTDLGPTVSTTRQFCTTPPPRIGAAAFADDKPPLVPGRIYLPNEVDESAAQAPNSVMPMYPATLRARGVTGAVTARFVVDPDGRVQTETIQIVRSDDPDFSEAVRTALRRIRYLPATLRGAHVHMLATQSFTFSITPGPP